MATITTYRTLVANEVGDTSARAQNVIDDGIKAVYQEMLLHTAKWLINPIEEDVTASTSNRYITPTKTYSEFRHILFKEVGDDNYYELKPISEEEYYSFYINSDSSRPTGFYIKGNLVYFDVVPSTAGTVKISGVEVQDELTGSIASLIPDRFTYILVAGAIAWFKAYEGTPDASEYQKIYKGSYWGQGRIDGLLGGMIQELSTKEPVKRPKLFGR